MTAFDATSARSTAATDEPLLSVRNLHVQFNTYEGPVYALDGVDLDVYPGETAGLVGETGCGKSVTARSILRLIDSPGEITEGEILFRGRNLLTLSERELRALRGNQIAMIFQEPMKALNPAFTIEDQLTTVIKRHTGRSEPAARARALNLLDELGLADPDDMLSSYPHELSGGMAQRVLIALSLSCEPELILADEPTTALDVTIQAQILNLLERIQDEYGTSILFITHNLGLVDQICETVNVMYAGTVVESGPTDAVFTTPQHPYTVGLLGSVPTPEKKRLTGIEGDVPDLRNPPEGCRYEPRCPYAKDVCETYDPPSTATGNRRTVRCIYYEPDKPGAPEEIHRD